MGGEVFYIQKGNSNLHKKAVGFSTTWEANIHKRMERSGPEIGDIAGMGRAETKRERPSGDSRSKYGQSASIKGNSTELP